MKTFFMVALVSVVWSISPIGSDAVKTKSTVAIASTNSTAASTPEGKIDYSLVAESIDGVNNGTSPCERYLRSVEVEIRNPRNHKFVTSNGWTERQRPLPEINVYSRIEDLPPSPQPAAATASAAYYQQQRDSYYQNSRQQQQLPTVRTSKRIIYYATLPDVIRPPAGYPPPGYPTADPYALGPGPYSADFRQLDSNRNLPLDGVQRNRLVSYENAYNHGDGNNGNGGSNGIQTSVTSKSSALYNSKYDEPAEFRDSFYRPNNEFSSKFTSWSEPFYKSWSSPAWDKEPLNRGIGGGSWDKEPFNRGIGGSPWDREPLNKGTKGSSWDREPFNRVVGGGGLWDSRGSSSWDGRSSPWDKEFVEVPLQKPSGGSNNNFNNNEVTVVQSGVIDVRGGNQQPNGSPPPPTPRFTIIDVDPKPYHQQQEQQQQQQVSSSAMRYDERSKPAMMQQNMRHEPPEKPIRYEAYTPMEPPTRYEQQPLPVPPSPSSMWYEQQYRPPLPSARYGHQQNQNKLPSNGYYEAIKNNINTHQFMTSWTEVSTKDDVSPTISTIVDITSVGNSTSIQNNRITPYTNSTKN